MEIYGLFLIAIGLVGASSIALAATVAVVQAVRLLPADRNAWHRFGELHGLTAGGETRWSGEVDGLAVEVTEPLGGRGPFGRATVFTLFTEAAGLHVVRRTTDKVGVLTGHDAFDRAARAIVAEGAHHQLHAELREAWLDADDQGFAEILPDGRVCLALEGIALDDARLSDGLAQARLLATQRLATPTPTDFLARPEPPQLLVATLDALARTAPSAARRAARLLLAHPDQQVRLAAAAATGPEALLEELRGHPVGVLTRLPVEHVPAAFARLGQPQSVPTHLRRVAARRLASEPGAEALPLLRWLLATDDAQVQTHAAEALGAVGTIDDVPALRALPAQPAGHRAVAEIQERAGGVPGAVSLSTTGQAGRLAVAEEGSS